MTASQGVTTLTNNSGSPDGPARGPSGGEGFREGRTSADPRAPHQAAPHQAAPHQAAPHQAAPQQAAPHAGTTIAGRPDDLKEAAGSFLRFSGACEFLAQTSHLQDRGDVEYHLMSPYAYHPGLQGELHRTVGEVLGILQSAKDQFADAWTNLHMQAATFEEVDRG